MAKRQQKGALVLKGPGADKRNSKKRGVMLSEVNDYNLDVVVSIRQLQGGDEKVDGSTIVNEAVSQWLAANGYPTDRFIQLSLT